MTREMPASDEQTTQPLPQEWFDRAKEVAEQLNIPLPDEQMTVEEAENRITRFEQRGGE